MTQLVPLHHVSADACQDRLHNCGYKKFRLHTLICLFFRITTSMALYRHAGSVFHIGG
jgi:hypothetical protein